MSQVVVKTASTYHLHKRSGSRLDAGEYLVHLIFLPLIDKNSLALFFESLPSRLVCMHLFDCITCCFVVLRFKHPQKGYWVLSIEKNPIRKGTKEHRVNAVSQCRSQND